MSMGESSLKLRDGAAGALVESIPSGRQKPDGSNAHVGAVSLGGKCRGVEPIFTVGETIAGKNAGGIGGAIVLRAHGPGDEFVAQGSLKRQRLEGFFGFKQRIGDGEGQLRVVGDALRGCGWAFLTEFFDDLVDR